MLNSCGPGWRSKIWNAATRIAAVAEVGIPIVSSGHEHAGERRVVGRLRPGDALDRAAPELLLCLPARDPALERVGEEGRDLGPAGRHRAEREAERGPAQPRLPRAPHVLAPQRLGALDLEQLVLAAVPHPRRHVERLADREQPDRHQHDVDAVVELADAERQPRLAAHLIDPDQPDEEPDEQRQQAADQRAADQRGDGHKGQHGQREVVRRLQLDGEVGDRLGEEGQQQDPDRAGHEGADRRRRERRSATPALGHLVALDRGRHRRGLARRVEQDRRRRPAVHPAEVDAGEHDEGAGRLFEVEGDREQQRDRQRRPDPRQHADERAEQHAERRERQVLRRQDGSEAVDQVAEDCEDGEHVRRSASARPGATRPGTG